MPINNRINLAIIAIIKNAPGADIFFRPLYFYCVQTFFAEICDAKMFLATPTWQRQTAILCSSKKRKKQRKQRQRERKRT
jgi:hypothetical protein